LLTVEVGEQARQPLRVRASRRLEVLAQKRDALLRSDKFPDSPIRLRGVLAGKVLPERLQLLRIGRRPLSGTRHEERHKRDQIHQTLARHGSSPFRHHNVTAWYSFSQAQPRVMCSSRSAGTWTIADTVRPRAPACSCAPPWAQIERGYEV